MRTDWDNLDQHIGVIIMSVKLVVSLGLGENMYLSHTGGVFAKTDILADAALYTDADAADADGRSYLQIGASEALGYGEMVVIARQTVIETLARNLEEEQHYGAQLQQLKEW